MLPNLFREKKKSRSRGGGVFLLLLFSGVMLSFGKCDDTAVNTYAQFLLLLVFAPSPCRTNRSYRFERQILRMTQGLLLSCWLLVCM